VREKHCWLATSQPNNLQITIEERFISTVWFQPQAAVTPGTEILMRQKADLSDSTHTHPNPIDSLQGFPYVH
jgi:hypothetical protein